ncbi:hypothetical protein NIASO_13005 [Niabella soli DSM 19437]|uniref:Uncharacterized protein n=1 Tax=Niabella soli DSM 19437 TaxID=929713 RepID=W0F7E4_9BACT|nr:hypothetical protein NIASO_13005 [Niabella soli DSM 19437]
MKRCCILYILIWNNYLLIYNKFILIFKKNHFPL